MLTLVRLGWDRNAFQMQKIKGMIKIKSRMKMSYLKFNVGRSKFNVRCSSGLGLCCFNQSDPKCKPPSVHPLDS